MLERHGDVRRFVERLVSHRLHLVSQLSLTTPNGTYHYSASDHAGLPAKYIAVDVVKNGKLTATDWATTELAAVAGG